MSVGIFEINAAAAVVMIYLARLAPRRIRPVLNVLRFDPLERGIKLVFADQKRKVLLRDVLICFEVIDRNIVR